MSMVLFMVWFSIQRIIKKCPGYYSAYRSGFNVLFKNVQGIILCKVLYSAYYIKKCPGYYSASGFRLSILFENGQDVIPRMVQDSTSYLKLSRVLLSVWLGI